MSYTQLLYHIVIRTKYGSNTLDFDHSEDLYKYITGYVKNKKSLMYQINGVSNHIHMLVSLHPTLSMSNFVKDLKTSANNWIKANSYFPKFISWGAKYGAFSCSNRNKDVIIRYIKNQREHHKCIPFKDEYRQLIVEAGIEIDEKYFLKD